MDDIRIALIDDDAAVLDSLRLYLERSGIAVACFDAAEAFIALGTDAELDCIVADVRMPGMSGIELVQRIGIGNAVTPVILITGHGDVAMAVAAVKLGAFDFIEKPFDEKRLLEAIGKAVEHSRQARSEALELAELKSRVATLTDRQRQVMELAVTGLSNKEIAIRLGISPRTVEIHRAWMMERVGARNLAELVRIGMRLDWH